MSDQELEEVLLDNGAEGAGFFKGGNNYSAAVIGVTHDGCVVYDFEEMINCLMKDDGMTSDEAMEWIDVNVIPSIPYMGEKPPVVVFPLF